MRPLPILPAIPHRSPRRRLLAAAGGWSAAATGAAVWPRRSIAQGVTGVYPERGRTIRLVLGLVPGGSLDAQARTIAQAVSDQTGVDVEVENRPGAAFIESAQEVSEADPDGYTLLYAPSSLFAQNPHILANLPYDPFTDFTPITLATRGPLLLTTNVARVSATNVRELIAWARAHPGKLTFGSFGPGSTSHLYAKAFARTVDIEAEILQSDSPMNAIRDLLEGRFHAYFDAATTAMANARTGRVRLLAVALPERNRILPDVPTLAEQGVAGLDLPTFTMIAGPARMEPRRVLLVNEVFVRALSTPTVVDAIAGGAFETVPSTATQAATQLRIAYDKWGEMVQRIGYRKLPVSG